jgi:hypothetical protein
MSAGPPDRPVYKLPLLPLPPFAFDLLFGRRRSFAHDSALTMANNPYPRRVEGLDTLPAESSFVLMINHYNRQGLHPYHCAMAVSEAVATRRPAKPELRWAFTSEWYGRRIGPLPIPVGLIRWLFRRVGLVYDLVVLPRRQGLVMARAAALRHVLSVLATAPIGITPEGAGSGHLQEPPVGSGLFLASIARRGYPLIPVAVCEEGPTLVIRFGEPLALSLAPNQPREEQDRLAREQVMVSIGRLLPREYWGVYEDAVERSLSETPAGG